MHSPRSPQPPARAHKPRPQPAPSACTFSGTSRRSCCGSSAWTPSPSQPRQPPPRESHEHPHDPNRRPQHMRVPPRKRQRLNAHAASARHLRRDARRFVRYRSGRAPHPQPARAPGSFRLCRAVDHRRRERKGPARRYGGRRPTWARKLHMARGARHGRRQASAARARRSRRQRMAGTRDRHRPRRANRTHRHRKEGPSGRRRSLPLAPFITAGALLVVLA